MIKKLWAFCSVIAVNGQDVATYTKNLKQDIIKSEVTISGYCQTQAAFNSPTTQGRDLFTHSISGLITLNYAKRLSCPIQFFSNQRENKISYQSPITFPTQQWGISPSYKNTTVFLGYKSISFSENSLNGMGYKGLGAQFKSKKSNVEWTIVYGQFLNNALNAFNAYKRNGLCTKLKIGQVKKNIGLIVCQWRDDLTVNPTSPIVQTPGENLVLGLQSSFEVWHWRGTIDVTQSHYTYNLLQPIARKNRFTYFNEYYNARQSTRSTNAVHLSLARTFKTLEVAWHLKKIDPGYNSMGIGFVNGDLLSLQQSGHWHTANQKIKINSDLNYLKNNLDRAQTSTLHRLSAQHHLATQFSQAHTFNFSHLVSISSQNQMHQLIQQIQSQFCYTQSKGEKTIQFNWQETFQFNTESEQTTTAFYVHALHINLHQPNKKSQNSFGYTLNQLMLGSNQVYTHTVFTTIHRQLFKNKLTLSTSCFIQQPDKLQSITLQLQGRYNITKHQAIILSSHYQFQNRTASNNNMYRLQLNYQLSFKPQSFSREK